MSSHARDSRDSQGESNIVDNTNVTIVSAPDNSSESSNPESAQNKTAETTEQQSSQIKPNNELSNTEFPQPAIIRPFQDNNNNSSIVHVLEETPPPPYPTDSNIQMPIPSHSRDHTTITLSPPEYTQTITTQPQAITHPSHNRTLSDITNEGDALLASTQELKFCKICQESEQPTTAQDEAEGSYHKGKLISPCKCKGSLQYVHIGCLNQWRNSNVRQEASYRCEVCKYEYKFYRPRLARIFSSSLTLHFLTLVLLFSVIFLFSYIVKLVNTNDVQLPYDPNDPNKDPTAPPSLPPPHDKRKWQDIQFLNLRMIDWIIGTSIVSCLGLVFFMALICVHGFTHTRSNFCYCGGCPFWYGYGGFGGDCSSMSGDCGGIFIIMILLILLAMFTIGFFGAIIAAYLFIQKITTICLEKVHDRILEVKKD